MAMRHFDLMDRPSARCWRERYEFDTYQDWLDKCQQNHEDAQQHPERVTWGSALLRVEHGDKARGWRGVAHYGQAMELARYGWPEGLERVRRLQADAPIPMARAPRYGFDVAGVMPNVPAYLSGDPAHMMAPTYEAVRDGARQQVTVTINASASYLVDPDAIIRRGIALMEIVDMLEAGNVRVTIDMAARFCALRYEEPEECFQVLRWNVKAAEEAIDRDRVIFNLAHPCTLRSLAFGFVELHPYAEKTHEKSRGNRIGTHGGADSLTLADCRPGSIIMQRIDRRDNGLSLDGWRRKVLIEFEAALPDGEALDLVTESLANAGRH